MTQIRNPSFACTAPSIMERTAHPLYLTLDGLSAAIEHHGIKVALQSDGSTINDTIGDLGNIPRVERPVEADGVVSCACSEGWGCAFCKQGERDDRELPDLETLTDFVRDTLQIRQRKRRKVVRRQISSIRIEYLQKLLAVIG